MREFNIEAIGLSQETREKEGPEVWKKIKNGEYRIVYTMENVLLDKTGYFWKDILKDPSCPFMQRLALVAIDEAHVIWEWKKFRPLYSYLYNIRHATEGVPWLCCSATLTANTMAYVHEVLGLDIPCYRLTTPLRRDNINIVVSPVDGDDPRPLRMFVEGYRKAKKVPKTIIYVDDVDLCRHLCHYLISRLPRNQRSANFALPYYGDLDETTKANTQESFRSGTTRIVVATDAFGLGVNIKDVRRVAQWQVTDKLTCAALSQRMGRCVRDSKLIGVFILFVKKSLIDEASREAWKDAWKDGDPSLYEDPDVVEDGNTLHFAVADVLEDCMNGDDDSFGVPISKGRQLDKFGIPLTEETAIRCKAFLRNIYVPIASLAELHETFKKQLSGTRKEPVTLVQKMDPLVLWFIRTEGCKHRLLGWIFGCPNVWDNTHKDWCCGSCIIQKGGDLNKYTTKGISAGRNQWNANPPERELTPPPEPPEHLKATRPCPLTDDEKRRLRETILFMRNDRWRRTFEARYPDGIADILLPERCVDHIVKRALHIVTEDQLRWELDRGGIKVQHSLIDGLFLGAIILLIDLVQKRQREIRQQVLGKGINTTAGTVPRALREQSG